MTWFIALIALAVTLLAATVEAKGYMHSFAAFKDNFNSKALALSFCWYSLGIIIDYVALWLLSKSSVFIPELMAMIFMVTTIVVIALLSGEFAKWQRIDQAVAVFVVLGIAWLTYRVGK